MAERDREPRPGPWDTRIDHEPCAANAEPQTRLETGAIQPACGSRVPGPAPAADVRGLGVDVRRDDVGLDPVTRDGRRRTRALDRIQHPQQLADLVSVPEGGKGHDRPDRRVPVLTPVLAPAAR